VSGPEAAAAARGAGPPGSVFRRAWLALGAAWALAWTAFAVAAASAEGPASVPYAAAFVASLAAVLGAAWRWPRGGGVAAIAAGVTGALLVDHLAARLLLFAPAVLLGVLALAAARGRPRRPAGSAPAEWSAPPGGTSPLEAPGAPAVAASRAARRLPRSGGAGLRRNRGTR
jgi:hypothetical protein